MIKSNILKSVPYPDGFTEEDKIEYDNLYAQAKIIHSKVEEETPFIIHTAIIGYIRGKKGEGVEFTNEELEEVKKSYELKSKQVKCEVPEDHYIYDKENNPMYFPATLTISTDENNSNIIIES
jgi:hypothetical protein